MEIKTVLWRPHKYQQLIRRDNHRFKVVICGRRFGKTTLAINILIEKALSKKGLYWYVSPTYRQSKTISWTMLLNSYYLLPKELQIGKNESELWVNINGSKICLLGADNEDSLRGSGLDGLVLDEVASMRNFGGLWQEVLRPALSDKLGWCIFISTPKGKNFFYDLSLQESMDPDYKTFKYTSYDNPYLRKEEVDKAKMELPEDVFAQEYMADFKKHTGLIHKEFDRRIHVIDPIDLPKFWRFYRAMDFGAVDPTVCLWIAVDNSDNIYIFYEYYHTGVTTKSHAEFILANTKENVLATFGDPSGNQEILDYASFGLFITPATRIFAQDKDWVISGIDKVREYLKPNSQTGRPKLFVFKNCINLIKDFESYHWKESNNDVLKDTPDHANSHGMDAIRYFVVSYNPQSFSQYGNSFEPEYSETTGYSMV